MNVKPKHNQYDNIWEIRQAGYPSPEGMKNALKRRPLSTRRHRIGKALVYDCVEDFLQSCVRMKQIRMPIFKIIIPDLGRSNTGAIYYIVTELTDTRERVHIYRATYGYYGTGPHEAALIESVFDYLHSSIELRSGDFLLGFISR